MIVTIALSLKVAEKLTISGKYYHELQFEYSIKVVQKQILLFDHVNQYLEFHLTSNIDGPFPQHVRWKRSFSLFILWFMKLDKNIPFLCSKALCEMIHRHFNLFLISRQKISKIFRSFNFLQKNHVL